MSKEKKNPKPQTPKTGEFKTRTLTEINKRSITDIGDKLNEDKLIKAMEVPKRPITTKPKGK